MHPLGRAEKKGSEETRSYGDRQQYCRHHDGRRRPVENGPGDAPQLHEGRRDGEAREKGEREREREKWTGRPERMRQPKKAERFTPSIMISAMLHYLLSVSTVAEVRGEAGVLVGMAERRVRYYRRKASLLRKCL